MMIDVQPLRGLRPSSRLSFDERWPVVAAALAQLCAVRRRSVRIVDAECGEGRLLVQAALHARALGFLAIEARGIDRDPVAVALACRALASIGDAAIGLSFEAGDPVRALASEAEFPADIVLWHGGAGLRPDLAAAAEAAGRLAIGGAASRARMAA